jgi:cytosine/adenosine deaminase-related metal-dependent hydrolase
VILRARILWPVGRPPIADGAVVVHGKLLAAVGPWTEIRLQFQEPVMDLGEVVLLPGLINAHCHLDYTRMCGIPALQPFPDWIKALLALKAQAGYSDFAEAWLTGAAMLLRAGTTTVGDIEAVPELLPEVWTATPLRVISFLELTIVKSRRAPALVLREAEVAIDKLKSERNVAWLSPHAPYSTTAPLLAETARLARRRNWRTTMHVAESQEEFEMFKRRRGALFKWLKNQRDMEDCGRGTPMAWLEHCGLLGDNFLAVHANYLEPADIQALARSGSSVVHCPRSHAYFGHQHFPYDSLVAAGVNVCLGTDSLASVATKPHQTPKLSLFDEMQTFASAHPAVAPPTIVEMATRNAALALGRAGLVGELEDLVGFFQALLGADVKPNSRNAPGVERGARIEPLHQASGLVGVVPFGHVLLDERQGGLGIIIKGDAGEGARGLLRFLLEKGDLAGGVQGNGIVFLDFLKAAHVIDRQHRRVQLPALPARNPPGFG